MLETHGVPLYSTAAFWVILCTFAIFSAISARRSGWVPAYFATTAVMAIGSICDAFPQSVEASQASLSLSFVSTGLMLITSIMMQQWYAILFAMVIVAPAAGRLLLAALQHVHLGPDTLTLLKDLDVTSSAVAVGILASALNARLLALGLKRLAGLAFCAATVWSLSQLWFWAEPGAVAVRWASVTGMAITNAIVAALALHETPPPLPFPFKRLSAGIVAVSHYAGSLAATAGYGRAPGRRLPLMLG